MAQLHIDFEWHRDEKGYDLFEPEPAKAEPKNALRAVARGDISYTGTAVTLSGTLWETVTPGKPLRVVRRGGNLTRYSPLTQYDGLFRQFANIATTPAGVLDFIEKFGPLTVHGLNPEKGDDVRLVIQNAEAMNGVLEVYSRAQKVGLARALGTSGIRLTAIDAALVLDLATKAPRLQLTVKDLLAALWLQFGQAISSGAKIQNCRQCGVLFEAGPGTGRRLDAKFCCDDHRIAFNSLKRTKES